VYNFFVKIKEGKAIPVCSQLAGLYTPRKAVEGPINDKVLSEDGEGVTTRLLKENEKK